MKIKIVKDSISEGELREIGREFYGTMVKAVVDVKRNVVAFGGEWHVDANEVLIKDGSLQTDVWGFNIYVDKPKDKRLEYISLINIRPAMNNFSMEVEDLVLREKIKGIIDKLVP